jgi:hypothetical protein
MKMQSGSGLFLIGDITRIATTFQALLDLSSYATITYVTTLFGTLRDGYDPTFRINPDNGILEWSYSSPSHPSPSGSLSNPWRSLGLVIGAVSVGMLGIFEAEISSPVLLPVGYTVSPISSLAGSPGFTTVKDILQFTSEVEDTGNNFSLLRRYTAPITAAYSFVLDSISLECVTETVPHIGWPADTVRLNFSFERNGALVGATWFIDLLGVPNLEGEVFPLPSQNLNINLNANDEIVIRYWFHDQKWESFDSQVVLDYPGADDKTAWITFRANSIEEIEAYFDNLFKSTGAIAYYKRDGE